MRFAAAVTSLTSFLAPATVRTGTGIAHVISRRGGEHGSSLLFGTTSKTMAMFSSSCNKEDNDGNNMSAKDQEQEQNETQPQIVPVVGESTIRLMTRLAQQYNAVNLSQGFPNEPPPAATRLRLAMGILTGQAESQTSLGSPPASEESLKAQLMEYLSQSTTTCSEEQQAKVPLPTAPDVLNQYSPPMGRPDLRQAVADYYQTHYSYTDLDADSQITITLGATEAFATALRTVGRPGDKVVILEPFHELYPSQCSIFYLEPMYVTLRENNINSPTTEGGGGGWTLDMRELERALADPKATILALNTPHNPTGKVFTHDELSEIVRLCLQYNVTIVTDEIYEHMAYDVTNKPHILLPHAFPEISEQCFVCNSIGKSASATGWRVGWCLHPSSYTQTYRGIHDQLVVMSPHPMQYATIQYLQHDCDPREIRHRYQSRLRLLGDALREVGFGVPNLQMTNTSSLELLPVEGAYYLFVKFANVPALQQFVGRPMEAAMYLMEEVGVACVPGDNFYGSSTKEKGEYVRFAACRSVQDVTEACKRIRDKLGNTN